MTKQNAGRLSPAPRWALAVGLAVVAVLSGTTAPAAAVAVDEPLLQQVGTGSFANKSGTSIQSLTQVETDTFSWGSTVVSAYQAGRSTKGFGAAAIGFSTSTDSGRTWTAGLLPGLTASSPSPNTSYPLVVNQSVAYDAAHDTWLVPSVTYVKTGTTYHEKALLVSRSTTGVSWQQPVTAVPTNADKAWGACDNTDTSAYYGTCYVVYTQLDSGLALAVVTSLDGGATWSAPTQVPDGLGGQAVGYNAIPAVRPDGTVVVVATDLANGANGSALISFTSTDGGASWSAPTSISKVKLHNVTKIRALNKPTVDVDASGALTVVWADCRFRLKCAANDLVSSTSADGSTWSAPAAIALSGSTRDKFDPGVAVAPGTSGSSAQLSLVYYTSEVCGTTLCLDAEYTTSYDGGATWSAPYQVNSDPMPITWFPNSPKGRMVGDHNSVSFLDGGAVTVLPLAAHAPNPYAVVEWALTLPVGWPSAG